MEKVIPEKGPEPKITIKGLSNEVVEMYYEPIQSAKSKFDHCDVYFANEKNPIVYSQMIANECLKDIEIDKNDV